MPRGRHWWPPMDESELESIWMTDIPPIVGERMIPASHPITVFLGGQPAAGKTRAQRRLTGIYDGLLAPIIGDDFRRYHPDYRFCFGEKAASSSCRTNRSGHGTAVMAVKYGTASSAASRADRLVIPGRWWCSPSGSRPRDCALSAERRPESRSGNACTSVPTVVIQHPETPKQLRQWSGWDNPNIRTKYPWDEGNTSLWRTHRDHTRTICVCSPCVRRSRKP